MAKKKNKREKELQKFVAGLVVIIIITVIVLAVFYISNGYKFDFGFLKKESESVSVNYSEVDNVRDLKVYFIDIGQGDCIFIELPDGKNMLIDTGEKRNAGKAKIDKYLRDEKGNKVTIDYCVATHPDSDHIGLMPYVYEQYDVLKSYRPYVYSENKSASALPYELNKGIKIKNSSNIYYDYITNVNAEQTYWEFFKDDSDFSNGFTGKDGEIYEYTVNFVMPYADNLNDYQYFTTPNDFSAVIMLEYADRKILFTGDIEYETGKKGAEQSFIREFSTSNPAMVDCDVLKVAHHGSDSSTSPEFLSLVKPEYSVISCGLSNKHRHPLKSTLDNLVNCGSEIYRTDLQGTIILTIDSKGIMTFEKQTDKYDGKILDDGDTIKQYEIDHADEIEKFKATL
mgnify:FL=1